MDMDAAIDRTIHVLADRAGQTLSTEQFDKMRETVEEYLLFYIEFAINRALVQLKK